MDLGVDWSSGAWLCVGYPMEGSPIVELRDTLEEIWTDILGANGRMVVDVPIGLCECLEANGGGCVERDGALSRACDDYARRIISPRSSSVFTPPARESALLAAYNVDYSTVNDRNRELTGKGLMKQAVNISPGIIEVDELIAETADSERLLEGHPELSFRAFHGESLLHNKMTAAGVAERLAALESIAGFESSSWRDLADQLRDEEHGVGLDDLLDALALAVTAAAPEEELYRLPRDPPTDGKNRPMQMVYRRDEPFPKSMYT